MTWIKLYKIKGIECICLSLTWISNKNHFFAVIGTVDKTLDQWRHLSTYDVIIEHIADKNHVEIRRKVESISEIIN